VSLAFQNNGILDNFSHLENRILSEKYPEHYFYRGPDNFNLGFVVALI